jgi:hypothetical protein
MPPTGISHHGSAHSQTSPPTSESQSKRTNSKSPHHAHPEVIEAWEKIAKRDGLDREVFFQASWAFGDGVTSFQHQLVLDMSKVSDSSML